MYFKNCAPKSVSFNVDRIILKNLYTLYAQCYKKFIPFIQSFF